MSIINKCQICRSSLKKFLDLGKQPLCDDLIPIDSKKKNKVYKSELLFCKKCVTVFHKHQVRNKILFPKSYHYRSSLTQDVIEGMKLLFQRVKKIKKNIIGRNVLDIGCNDGTLLEIFKKAGCNTFGVEPTNAAKIAEKKHVIYNDFFNEQLAKKIKKQIKKIDVIVFTNVFAHINNLKTLIKGLRLLIDKDTLIVIENHYLGSVIKRKQFDTFYHEHPRTYSLTSFLKISELLSLNLTLCEFPKRYGGNIRVFLSKKKSSLSSKKKFKKITTEEKKYFFEKLKKFQKIVSDWKKQTKTKLVKMSKKYELVGKAFPGRASILINLLNINNKTVRRIYEKSDSPKIGHFAPNTNIPIVSDKIIRKLSKKAIIINFSWHISKEIRSYLNKLNIKNKILNIL